MQLTSNEQNQLAAVERRQSELRAFLLEQQRPASDGPLSNWFAFLSAMKQITGNASNDLSFIATLMAKEFLCSRLDMAPFDAALKPQGAPGLDIDERTRSGERVVAEIKTTVPYLETDLGAAQKATFRKDFGKLQLAEAPHKFFFLTNTRTYDIVNRKYAADLGGVSVVLLPVEGYVNS
jgi:hypothetical protein